MAILCAQPQQAMASSVEVHVTTVYYVTAGLGLE